MSLERARPERLRRRRGAGRRTAPGRERPHRRRSAHRGQDPLLGRADPGPAAAGERQAEQPRRRALEAYQVKVGADLQCYRGFDSDGLVRITGARIAGHARFDEATLRGDGTDALDARYAEIGGAARCRAVHATGAIRFASARIANDMDFREAVVARPASSTAPNLLFLGNLQATELTLRFAAPPAGGIHLANAHVTVLNDDPASWPPHFTLDGFVYDRIAEPGPVAARIAWLGREATGYRPGPYEQLATVYRRQGLDGEARRVLLAKQRARRRTLFPHRAAVGFRPGRRRRLRLSPRACARLAGRAVGDRGRRLRAASSGTSRPGQGAAFQSPDLLPRPAASGDQLRSGPRLRRHRRLLSGSPICSPPPAGSSPRPSPPASPEPSTALSACNPWFSPLMCWHGGPHAVTADAAAPHRRRAERSRKRCQLHHRW